VDVSKPLLITLTTDFGYRSPFSSIMKGVIHEINPNARIYDLTHGIAPHNITECAFVLLTSYSFFPEGTIHVSVVDPGVGGRRKAVAIETERYLFVGPDNGIFSWALEKEKIASEVEITNPAYMRTPVSQTFHGRDIFAPAAAHLSRGVAVTDLGSEVESLVSIPFPHPTREHNTVIGEIIYIDTFGNLVTNIRPGENEVVKGVTIKNLTVMKLSNTYRDVAAGEITAYVGSFGFLEVGKNLGNAAESLCAEVGDSIFVVI
jgi:S-adenosylmethionine hydrolase